MRVIWSPLAIERAADAAAFIAIDSPAAARRWVDGLFEAAAALSKMPERGRRVPELARAESFIPPTSQETP